MFSIIGFFVGWIISGRFLGGVVGLLLGSLIDRSRTFVKNYKRERYNKEQFIKILLPLAVCVMKADGTIKEVELKHVAKHLVRNFSAEYAKELYRQLHNYIENNVNINIDKICQELHKNATEHEKLYIIQFLLGIAASDGIFQHEELNVVQQISDRIGISRRDFESIKAMYTIFNQGSAYYGSRGYQYGSGSQSYSGSYSSGGYSSGYRRPSYSLDNDYNILEVSSTATDDEVKKAYRRLAQKYHPDKVNHLGEEIRKDAEIKFVKLNQAYERIKESRNMK